MKAKPLVWVIATVTAAVLLAVGIVLQPCRGMPELVQGSGRILCDSGNLSLFVTNQSPAVDPVDIFVQIDDDTILHEYFEVADQHHYKKFSICINTGPHAFHVRSHTGRARLDTTLHVDSSTGAVLSYVYYPPEHYSPMREQFLLKRTALPFMID